MKEIKTFIGEFGITITTNNCTEYMDPNSILYGRSLGAETCMPMTSSVSVASYFQKSVSMIKLKYLGKSFAFQRKKSASC